MENEKPRGRKQIRRSGKSIVFYTSSVPFHPGTILKKGLGGSESALIHLSRELAARGHSVRVFCSCDAPGEYDGVVYRDVTELPAYLSREEPDIFISLRIPKIFVESIPARLKWYWAEDSFDQPHIQCLMDPALVKRIDRIVTVSRWQADTYRKHFKIPENKFLISRNGFHPPFFEAPFSEQRPPRLAYASTPFRGLDVLLDLFPIIRREVPETELYIYSSMAVYGVSREEDEKTYGDLYRKAEQKGVHLMGSIPQDRLARELMKARLLAYPNHFAETSCIAAIEAQAAGTPVVTTRLGGLTETVQHGKTGLLIPGDSRSSEYQEQFIHEIIHLLKDHKAWSLLSREARFRAFQEYRWEVIAHEWDQAFDSLLVDGRKPHARIRENGGLDTRILACQKEIEADPENPEPHNRLGLIYREAGEREKALEEFRKAIARYVIYDEAYENYGTVARELGIPLVRNDLDIVFYTVGAFTPDDLQRSGVGGSETAMMAMAGELACLGRRVIVFNSTQVPSKHEGVEYRNLADFFILNRFNRIPIFISSRVPMPFRAGVNADRTCFWIHDDCQAEYISKENLSDLNVDTIFAISRWQAETYAEHFGLPMDLFYITRNGVDLALFPSETLSRNRHKLVYASRPDRGLDNLLDLFPRIREKEQGTELHIFSYTQSDSFESDPELVPILPKLKQEGVVFRGSVPKEELYRELASARLMVYPSIWRETSCIAVLEAQAAGLPVVTTPLGALPESLAGGIFVPGNPYHQDYRNRFVQEVLRLMKDDGAWKELSDRGRTFVGERHPWSKIAAEWNRRLPSGRTRPTLSLCMIVKNEERYIGRCIESVRKIADEIVILDTGSTDRTPEIARKLGARVIRHPWKDDFSEARNRSIEEANGDWILVLDADETISDKDLPGITDLISDPDLDACFLTQRTYTDNTSLLNWQQNRIDDEEGKNYSGYIDTELIRLFRNDIRIRFRGEVHELVEHAVREAGLPVARTGTLIHHLGKVRDDGRLPAKGELYSRIGEVKLENAPDDPRAVFELAAQMMELHRYEEAVPLFEKVIALKPDSDESYLILGTAWLELEHPEKALESYEAAYRLNSRNADITYNLGVVYQRMEQHHRACEYFRKTLHLRSDHFLALWSLGFSEFMTKDYESARRHMLESIRINPRFAPSHNDLGVLYARAEEYDLSAEEFRKVLEINPEDRMARENLEKARHHLEHARVSPQNRNPTISLCVIVKNEEEMLPGCLESVKGLADEIVVVDTGSTDRTIEIAESFGARVIRHTWKDDFSEARNRSIDQAQCEWILVLDADERISTADHDHIRKRVLNAGAAAFDLYQRNYTEDTSVLGWTRNRGSGECARYGPGYFDVPITRLFRKDPKIRYVNRVHERLEETLDKAGIEHRQLNIPIHHLGKIRGEEFVRRKLEYYLELSKKKLKHNPRDAVACYEIGGTLIELGRFPDAVPYLEKASACDPAFSMAKILLGIACYRMGDLPHAREALAPVIKETQDPQVLKLWGMIALQLKHGEEALETFAAAYEINPGNETYLIGLAQAQVLCGRTQDAESSLDKALESNPLSPQAWNDLGCLRLLQDNRRSAESCFRKALEMDRTYRDARDNLAALEKQAAEKTEIKTATAGSQEKGFPLTVKKEHRNNTFIKGEKRSAPTLSVCMMVKNEEEMLAACLDSIQGHADEIIIVDTGSTDRTVEIARKYTDRVYFHAWENDFSRARNQTLRYAEGDWILQLDADEVVDPEDAPRLRECAARCPDECTHLFVNILNYDHANNVNASFHFPRLYRNKLGFYYEGIVHNQIRVTGQGFYSGIRIHHYGYALSPEKMETKKHRTLALLKKQIAEDPDNPWPRHNLCISYSMAGMAEETIEAGEEVNRVAQQCGHFPPYLFYSRYVTAATYCAQKNYERAMAIGRECLTRDPRHIDSCYVITLAAYQEDRFELVREMGERYLTLYRDLSRPDSIHAIPLGTLDFRTRLEKMLAHAWFVLGDQERAAKLFEAAIDHSPGNSDRYKEVGLFYHGQDQWREAQSYYERHLKQKPSDTYVLKAMADCFCQEKKFNKALEIYDRILEHSPNDQEVLYLKEYAQQSMIPMENEPAGIQSSDPEDADPAGTLLSRFEEILDRDPESLPAIKGIAFAALAGGDRQRAEKELLKALGKDESDPDVLVVLSRLYLEEGNLDASLCCMETLLSILGLPSERELQTREDLIRLYEDVGGGLSDRGKAQASEQAFEAAKNLREIHQGSRMTRS